MGRIKQKEKVLNWLQLLGSIEPAEALRELGVMRLAARIADLKKDGIKIKSERVNGVNRFGEPCHWTRYSLINNQE